MSTTVSLPLSAPNSFSFFISVFHHVSDISSIDLVDILSLLACNQIRHELVIRPTNCFKNVYSHVCQNVL